MLINHARECAEIKFQTVPAFIKLNAILPVAPGGAPTWPRARTSPTRRVGATPRARGDADDDAASADNDDEADEDEDDEGKDDDDEDDDDEDEDEEDEDEEDEDEEDEDANAVSIFFCSCGGTSLIRSCITFKDGYE